MSGRKINKGTRRISGKVQQKLDNLELQKVKVSQSMEIASPEGCGQWSTTRLVESDFSPRLMKSLNGFSSYGNEIVRTKLPYSLSTQVQQAGTVTNGAINFQGSLAPGFSDLSGAFDEYRMRAVTLTISPVANTYQVPSGGNNTPRLYTVIDFDDSIAPLTIAYLQQYGTCIVAPPSCGVIRSLCPHVANAVYSGAFTSFGNMEAPWIDCASPSVQHYGVKYAIEAGIVGQNVLQSYTFDVTLFMEFRLTR
jgi:hypothetical protein